MIRKKLGIMMLGDSLTEYFDWQARFPDHNVMNLGISGETVEGLMGRTGRIISSNPRADLIFIMSGINNLAWEEPDFLDSYGVILDRMADAYPNAEIYLQSILPTLLPWINIESIEKVNIFLKNLAENHNGKRVRYLDVYTRFIEGGPVELLSPDGIHLSDKGYETWAGVLEGVIGEA